MALEMLIAMHGRRIKPPDVREGIWSTHGYPCVQNKLYIERIYRGVIRYTFAFGGLWDLSNSGLAGCGFMRWALTVIVCERSFDMQEIGWLTI